MAIDDFVCVYPMTSGQIENLWRWGNLHVGDELEFLPKIRDKWLVDHRLRSVGAHRRLKILAITPLTNSVCLTLLVDNDRQLVLNFDEWPETTALLKKLGKGWIKCQR